MIRRNFCAAIAATMMCAPANAGQWVLGFTANVSGTSTTYCLDNNCEDFPLFDPIVEPVSGPITNVVSVDPFVGTQLISDEMIGDLGGQLAQYSGFIHFDGGRFTGTDFQYFEGGTADSQGEIWEASAPRFAVYTLPGQPGPVPEPATWAMMLLGFAVVGAAMRRDRTTTGGRAPIRAA